MVDAYEVSMPTEKWRWYLCIQKNPMRWECEQATALKALNGILREDGKQTKAIPVFAWQPRFLDARAIQKSLQPVVDIH